MKYLTIVACLIIILTSCNKKEIHNEHLSFQKMGYDKPGLFVYALKEYSPENKILKYDSIGLFCSNIILPDIDSQYYMEWQFLTSDSNGNYKIPEGKYDYESTGIKINDSVLFIHPPRFNYLKITQFCPYPYFYNRPVGSKWQWDFNIGANWAIDNLYPIKEVDTFHIQYTSQKEDTINTMLGKLKCYSFCAQSTSKYGYASGEYFVNNDLGLVSFTLTATNKMKFQFDLIRKINNLDSLSFNKNYLFKLNKNKERLFNNIINTTKN